MDIKRIGELSPTPSSAAKKGGRAEVAAKAPPQTGRVSDTALSSMVGLAKSVPDVDLAKVAKIKTAIESGNYRVNPEKIAEAMLQESKAFLGAQNAKKNR